MSKRGYVPTWVIVSLFVISIICVILAGCASKVAIPEPSPGLFGGVKAAIASISATTSWITFISIFGIGAGIAAVIWLPGDDKLPWGIVVGSGAMLGVSLFIQTSLGFFPWIVGAVLIFGGFWLYKNFRSRKVAKFLGNLVHHESTTHTK
jgi:uncharacterized protein YceK